MRHLLKVARADPSAPVPEIFPLASWAEERKPLVQWLAKRLQLRHGGRATEWEVLIADHQVMPVLDGLDEVAPEHRTACLREVNRLWESQRRGPLLLCCRLAEYEALQERAKFGGAVIVSPPREDQIDAYLKAAGPSWDAVRAELRGGTNDSLRELLATPLMLSAAVLAYQGANPDELGATRDAGSQRDRLWARYMLAMEKRGYDPVGALPDAQPSPYRHEHLVRWLGWIAFEMQRRNVTELWLHEWTGNQAFRLSVKAACGLIAAGLVAITYISTAAFPEFFPTGFVLSLISGLLVAIAVIPVPA